jgi:hypothetical protein
MASLIEELSNEEIKELNTIVDEIKSSNDNTFIKHKILEFNEIHGEFLNYRPSQIRILTKLYNIIYDHVLKIGYFVVIRSVNETIGILRKLCWNNSYKDIRSEYDNILKAKTFQYGDYMIKKSQETNDIFDIYDLDGLHILKIMYDDICVHFIKKRLNIDEISGIIHVLSIRYIHLLLQRQQYKKFEEDYNKTRRSSHSRRVTQISNSPNSRRRRRSLSPNVVSVDYSKGGRRTKKRYKHKKHFKN